MIIYIMNRSLFKIAEIDLSDRIRAFPDKSFSYFWDSFALETLDNSKFNLSEDLFREKRKLYPLGKILLEIKQAIMRKYLGSINQPRYLKSVKVSYSYIHNYMVAEIQTYSADKLHEMDIMKLNEMKCYIRSYMVRDEIKLVTI